MQDFGHWLDEQHGRAVTVADFFGVTRSAVSQWRSNGVPRDFLLVVHRLSGIPLDVLLAPPTLMRELKQAKKPRNVVKKVNGTKKPQHKPRK